MLSLGKMFAPSKNRDAPGGGFTHHLGDRVTIDAPPLGAVVNTVRRPTEIAPWAFGVRGAMLACSGAGFFRLLECPCGFIRDEAARSLTLINSSPTSRVAPNAGAPVQRLRLATEGFPPACPHPPDD